MSEDRTEGCCRMSTIDASSKSCEGQKRMLCSNDVELIIADQDGFGAIKIWDTRQNTCLVRIDSRALLIPSFASDAVCSRCEVTDSVLTLSYSSPMLKTGAVSIRPYLRGFLVKASFTPNDDATVCRLNLVPQGTSFGGFYTMNHFAARGGIANSMPEVILRSEGFEAHTISDYGYLSPRPTAMSFARHELRMMVGVTSAPVGGYGFRIKGCRREIHEFYLDYGEGEWGWKVKAGEVWQAPDIYVAFDRENDDFETHRLFAADLVKMGTIADPAKRVISPWNRQHQYCTWGDMTYDHGETKEAMFERCIKRYPGISSPLWMHTSEQMVLDAAKIMRREHLPVYSICVDAGWNVNTSDFRANEILFPHFREMVDQLHAMNYKVTLWWSWSELRNPSCIEAVGLKNCIMDGKLDKFGRPQPDFSKKSCQDEYLKPMIRRIFSSEPDCYDCDGLKLDYAADKVHPELPCENPLWRGEENYLVHFYGMLRREIYRYKTDIQLCACSPNWFLAEFLDTNRTGDVYTDDYLEHEMRARVIQACSPGTTAKYDFSGNTREAFPDYLDSAKRIGAITQFANVFGMLSNCDVGEPKTTAEDFNMLRKHF